MRYKFLFTIVLFLAACNSVINSKSAKNLTNDSLKIRIAKDPISLFIDSLYGENFVLDSLDKSEYINLSDEFLLKKEYFKNVIYYKPKNLINFKYETP